MESNNFADRVKYVQDFGFSGKWTRGSYTLKSTIAILSYNCVHVGDSESTRNDIFLRFITLALQLVVRAETCGPVD